MISRLVPLGQPQPGMKSAGLWARPPRLCTLLARKNLLSAPLVIMLGIFENYVQNLGETHFASRLLL